LSQNCFLKNPIKDNFYDFLEKEQEFSVSHDEFSDESGFWHENLAGFRLQKKAIQEQSVLCSEWLICL